MTTQPKTTLLASLVLALGIAAAGWMISTTVHKARMANNTVTVKGLAEREVQANLGIWTLGFNVTGGDLSQVQKQATMHQQSIIQFLESKGFAKSNMTRGAMRVQDFMSDVYNQKRVAPEARYRVDSEVTLRTDKVANIASAMQETAALINQGVVLTNSTQPMFKFTKLNEIKPEMLKSATQNAREAAQQFAEDSGTKVGNISKAQQGYFSIRGADGFEHHGDASIDKKIRVVTTVTFYLGE